MAVRGRLVAGIGGWHSLGISWEAIKDCPMVGTFTRVVRIFGWWWVRGWLENQWINRVCAAISIFFWLRDTFWLWLLKMQWWLWSVFQFSSVYSQNQGGWWSRMNNCPVFLSIWVIFPNRLGRCWAVGRCSQWLSWNLMRCITLAVGIGQC